MDVEREADGRRETKVGQDEDLREGTGGDRGSTKQIKVHEQGVEGGKGKLEESRQERMGEKEKR